MRKFPLVLTGCAIFASCGDDFVAAPSPTGGEDCIAEVESCDGEDNDCDGDIDETFNTGQECTAGEGPCAVKGKLICRADGFDSECDAEADESQKSEEICDGIDNDCNGEVDQEPACHAIVTVEEDDCFAFITVDNEGVVQESGSSPSQSQCWEGTRQFLPQEGWVTYLWDADDNNVVLTMKNVIPGQIAVKTSSKSDPEEPNDPNWGPTDLEMLEDLEAGNFGVDNLNPQVEEIDSETKQYTLIYEGTPPGAYIVEYSAIE